MFRFLFVFIFAFLFAVSVTMAGPFLTCDPPSESDGVTHYIVTIDTEGPVTVPIDQGRGTLFYDLAGISDGNHTVIVKAKNLWTESEPSAPFPFARSSPSSASGLAIISE